MPSARSTVATLPPAIHGARDYSELESLALNPADIIDFSTNTNPYGPHPTVLQAVRRAISTPALAHYPDRDCLALRAAIATADNVPVDWILPGNGVNQLIHLTALAFIRPGSRHLVLSPTFSEYARAIHLMGGVIYEHRPAASSPNLYLGVEEIAATIQRIQPDAIWICNPNNPTGQHWTVAELARLRACVPDDETLWIIDESYRHFVGDVEQTVSLLGQRGDNLILFRSLTKDYSLAGLRLGYALAPPPLIRALRAVQPSWSVNSLAQIAGIATLQEEIIAWRRQSLAQLHQHAADLWAGLTGQGLTVLPTTTTFALVAVDDAPTFRHRLLTHHNLLVRDCSSFGLPGHVRIAARQPGDNERLLAGIGALAG
jgi:histidinol-phosphate aminotransferase